MREYQRKEKRETAESANRRAFISYFILLVSLTVETVQ